VAFLAALFGCLSLSALLPKSVAGDASSFSMVLLPDTQKYARGYPEIFEKQTEWIRNKVEELNITCVVHLGDIVNDDTVEEWMVADRAMSKLDGIVPYSVLPGNHDMARGPSGRGIIREPTRFNAVFSPWRFRQYSWYGGHEGVSNANNYIFFHAAGKRFLVLSLEFGPSDAVLEWANQIVWRHPGDWVIVATHCYLYFDDTRVGAGDLYSPHLKGPDWNDGEEIWEKLVRRHPNIFLVVSGHVKGDGAGRLSSQGLKGNVVHQLLSNYQTLKNGGDGWLRIMTFVPGRKKIRVQTYSPTLNRYNHDPEQQFELDFDASAGPGINPQTSDKP
jgi:hypothetical protein